MDIIRPSRRDAMLLGLGAAASVALAPPLLAALPTVTRPVETTSGNVRGRRAGGISRFLGIPYGADTAASRFLPPVPPKPWSDVRDCFTLGAQAVQGAISMGGARGGIDMSSDFVKRMMAAFKATMETGPGSEDCLFLNVWTPDASPWRKRPVMVWLHGGGFAIGSGGDTQYEGSALARRGDVVVVTLNHRLNALGYLYLGGLDPDFADSGNSGTLDILLALQWVRDNISRFGGDPGNVTIFGESGGGAKVSVMLAVPAAQGLFHKAIIQSGPGLRMGDKAVASEIAGKTLAALDLAQGDVRGLQALDVNEVVRAAGAAAGTMGAAAMRTLSPVVDGRTLPTDPFDPVGPEVSRDIPVMIGTTKDESTLFFGADPRFGKMTAEEARTRFDAILKDRGAAAFEAYRKHYPDEAPTYWVTSMLTHRQTWMDSIRLAERKTAQDGAPAYMYRLDWQTPILDGMMHAPHGLDVPLVFDNAETTANLLGTGIEPKRIAAVMSQAWINFARTGDPSQPEHAWPAYEPGKRQTMIFNVESRVVSDPDGVLRRFWS